MSLHGPYDADNVFAKIMRDEIPSVRVWEDDDVLVFMDAFPQSRGHTLVISKTSQARNLLEVEPEVLSRLMSATQRTARALEKALKPEGFSLMQFNGEVSGQTVFHLHFHIVPRWTDQALKNHAQGAMADAGELKTLAAQIAAALDQA